MPPVREASTKPSAATVLPAPVACSNQKRLAALGSSAASPARLLVLGARDRVQSSGSSSGSSSTSSSGRSSSPGIAAEASISGSSLTRGAVRRAPLPLAPRCDSASSAVSVPESASTWWAESTVPSTSVGSSCESRRSRPSSSDQRRRHLLDGAVWPSASSFRTQSSATRRGIPGARDTDASSPSSRKGSRANASARSRSSEEGRGATARVAVSGSAMKARQIDVGGSRRYPPHGFELPDRNGETSSGRLPGKHPIFKQTRSDGDAASATVCPDATSSRPFSPGSRSSSCSSSGSARRAAGTAAPPPGRPSTSPRRSRDLAGAPAPLAALHDQSAELLDGGRTAFRRRLAKLEGYPVVVNKWASWCAPCRTEFPIFQSESVAKGKKVAFLGLNAGDSTRSRPHVPARVAAAVPVLRRPRGEHRQVDPGAGQLPDHGLLRRARRERLHPPGRLPQAGRPRRRPEALPEAVTPTVRRPATRRSSPPRSRCASRCSAASRA